MKLSTLSHRGIDAWLQDPNGARLTFPRAAVVQGNIITAVIEVEDPKSYSVEWCKSSGATAMNAWCEIFRPSGKSGFVKTTRIANHTMAADSPETQSRSSRDRLELPLQRNAWLWTPRSGEGFVSLEIRRMRKPSRETADSKKRPGSIIYDTPVDMLDDDDMPPHIIFRFEFALEKSAKARISFRESVLAPKTSKRGGRRVHKSRQQPLRSNRAQNARRPSDLSDLSSSESEPEEPLVTLREKNQRIHVTAIDRGEGSSNDAVQLSREEASPEKRNTTDLEKDRGDNWSGLNHSILSSTDTAGHGVEDLLRRRKIISDARAQFEEEQKQKHAEHNQLMKYLSEDTAAQAEKLAQEKAKARQLDDEIEKLKAAMHM
ncbi:hypothetical protein B0H16DRAFT_1881099 [Mycena metata]|uniref:Uncharacterized protein n=1 Tax=Mycena metata TaxID=1033252 RepID=A0AAD7JVL9_9AGAR|nr:hypothetical protein B0H16DRAFT_1881099 [Mycena metata]